MKQYLGGISLLLLLFTSFPAFAWNSLVYGGRCQTSRNGCYTTVGNADGQGSCCVPGDADVLYCASRDKCTGSRYYRWAGQDLPLKWNINLGGRPGSFQNFTEKQIIDMAKAAFDAWTHPHCSGFKHKFLGTTTKLPSTGDRIVTLYLVPEASWLRGNQALAYTQARVPRGSTTGHMYDGDIYFNPNPPSAWGIPPLKGGQTDLLHTAVHEIGHAIGFGHTVLLSSIMYYSVRGTLPYNGLQRDDIDGVCQVYPNIGRKTCTDSVQCGRCGTCVNGTCSSGGKADVDCPCSGNSDCKSPYLCTSGVCQRQGGGDELEHCSDRSKCKPGLHCYRIQRGDVCLKPCGVATGLPPGKPGSSCLFNGNCKDGASCLLLKNKQTVCAQTCVNKLSCKGGDCITQTIQGVSQKFCTCFTDKECQQGQVCNNQGKEGAPGVCATKASQDGTCGTGFSCQETHNNSFACLPTPGTADVGDSCTDGKSCKEGLKCAQTSPLKATAVCVEDCRKSINCKLGGVCKDTPWASKVCRCESNSQCPSGKYCRLNPYGLGECIGIPTCGNGTCDTSGGLENCETCEKDCGCKAGAQCKDKVCVENCGNGTCDFRLGENCSSCAKDCGCKSSEYCDFDTCRTKPVEPNKPETSSEQSDPTDAGQTGDKKNADGDGKGGCGCQSTQGSSTTILLFLLLTLSLLRRRRINHG